MGLSNYPASEEGETGKLPPVIIQVCEAGSSAFSLRQLSFRGYAPAYSVQSWIIIEPRDSFVKLIVERFDVEGR